jgi:hypothetical protein
MLAAALLFSQATGPSPLHVDGTKIVDLQGKEFRFHGINVCSLEWDAKGENVPKSIQVSLDTWGANLVRIPMSEDRWFGTAPDSKDDGAAYRAIIDQIVAEVEARGKYILLDMHWSNAGVTGKNIGQHDLPDDGTREFWKSCAKRYANRSAVLFDLYNEPIKPSWEKWRNGGEETETINGQKISYHAVGMQTLLEAIRATGAKNLIVAGGLGYASQMDGYPKYCLEDKTGQGVVYANHFYPGWESVDSWETRMLAATKFLPMIVSEFGGDQQSLPLDDPQRRVAQVLAVLKKHDWNWCAWCMHPAASPCLIADWTYKPTPYFGVMVMAALKGQDVPIPPQRTATTSKSVYDEALRNGFQSWSSAHVDLNSSTFHNGKKGIQVDEGANQQFQLGTIPFDSAPYSGISFWINGGPQGGQQLEVNADIMDTGRPPVKIPVLKSNEWMQVTISFDDLGVANMENVKSFVVKSPTGAPLTTYFVDDFSIIGKH